MWHLILDQFIATPPIEWLAFIFGVGQVWFAKINARINFYFGLVSVLLYTYVFYRGGLYAEAILNAYYVAISVQGLLMWKKQVEDSMFIRKPTRNDLLLNFGQAIVLFSGLSLILNFYTNSHVPIPDALVASLAWIGAYLLVKRRLDNWLWLTVSNIIAIPLQVYKGLPLTALLTIIYLVVGVLGYRAWRQLVKRQITA